MNSLVFRVQPSWLHLQFLYSLCRLEDFFSALLQCGLIHLLYLPLFQSFYAVYNVDVFIPSTWELCLDCSPSFWDLTRTHHIMLLLFCCSCTHQMVSTEHITSHFVKAGAMPLVLCRHDSWLTLTMPSRSWSLYVPHLASYSCSIEWHAYVQFNSYGVFKDMYVSLVWTSSWSAGWGAASNRPYRCFVSLLLNVLCQLLILFLVQDHSKLVPLLFKVLIKLV